MKPPQDGQLTKADEIAATVWDSDKFQDAIHDVAFAPKEGQFTAYMDTLTAIRDAAKEALGEASDSIDALAELRKLRTTILSGLNEKAIDAYYLKHKGGRSTDYTLDYAIELVTSSFRDALKNSKTTGAGT